MSLASRLVEQKDFDIMTGVRGGGVMRGRSPMSGQSKMTGFWRKSIRTGSGVCYDENDSREGAWQNH
jgi:hypothetical protein